MMHHILVLEDNKGDVELLKLMFLRYGEEFRIHVAQTGKELTNLLDSWHEYSECPERPDLFIIDILLAPENGLEILAQVKNHPVMDDVPAIVFSGFEFIEEKKRALEIGATDYIVKDTDFERNYRNIEQVFNRFLVN